MRWTTRPCKSKKNSIPRETRMGIEEILKMKLDTIKEEPDSMIAEENRSMIKKQQQQQQQIRRASEKTAMVMKNIHLKVKTGRKIFTSQLRFRESFVLFVTGFASKGGLNGLPRY